MPATLDLAEAAQLAVEGVLTRQTDPLYDYETYQQANFADPPIMYHSFHDLNGCHPKYLETLPLLRSISGTEVNLEVDRRLFEVSLRMIGQDGLTYVPVIGRPWALFDDWGSVLRKPNLPPPDVRHIFGSSGFLVAGRAGMVGSRDARPRAIPPDFRHWESLESRTRGVAPGRRRSPCLPRTR